ncbi:DUF1254 domain-containing protein [Desulfocurvibacter africanus]|uniref:DUF1254 domain-containing protein n=1 Tax=Desulfocurvibacter africanus TaxID=873 RepID=UPI002FDB0FC2
MKTPTRFAHTLGALLLSCAVVHIVSAAPAQQADISEQEAYDIAREAYIYAYPLVVMDVTRMQMINHAEPQDIGTGPANRFIHATEFPTAGFKEVVRPNVDTLYSSAWLDLTEPMVLTMPATERYMLLPIMSMWTDVFAVPGTRTTGTGRPRTFLLAGPGWRGQPPKGMEVIQSPTRWIWIIGRIQTNGKQDYAAVRKIQAGISLTPLSAWGKGSHIPPKGTVDPAVDMKTPPPAQVAKMDAATFFSRFAWITKHNPPYFYDYPVVHRMERIGLIPGQEFNPASLPPAIRKAVEEAYMQARLTLAAGAGEGKPGWIYYTRGGAYGTDYLLRATVALHGLGMNLPQDAVYLAISTDSRDRPLSGEHRYVIRLDKGEPPVDAFWSVTVYDKEGYFVPNPLDRYALGDRDKLVRNPEGSVELYLQPTSPGKGQESNWLPTPKGQFNLLLRLYSPKDEALDGSWTPPPVERRE